MSFILSLVIWLVVQSETQDKDFNFEVPLDMSRAHLAEGLVVLGDKVPKVTLKGHGPAEQVDKIKPDDLKPYVDLSRVGPITKSFTVKLDRAARDKDMGITWDPASTTLAIEQILKRDLPVTVVQTGSLRDPNMFIDSIQPEPEYVTISGPESAYKQAQKARVFFDLSTIGNGNWQRESVEILDDQNREVSGLTVEPSEVVVRPALKAANQRRLMFVNAIFKGQAEYGYRVSKTFVTPAQVEFTGPSEALAKLRRTTVDTRAIDLTGISQSITFTVKLDTSQFRGVTAKPSEVSVHVQVDPITKVPPLNPQSP